MRKNINKCHIEGYVYDSSKLVIKTAGEQSKNPGLVYIRGGLDIAVDEEAINVVTVNFTYVTEIYSKSKKPNTTFTVLKKIIETPNGTWVNGGKENAFKVKIDGSLALNDFISDQDERISARRCEGSFVSFVNELCEVPERNTFQTDIIITSVQRIEANPEKNINEDFVKVKGAAFNYANALLPAEFTVHNKMGMEHFENLDVTKSEPVYTKIWGHINSQSQKIPKVEESAWGEAAVTFSETKRREWEITGTSKVPYDFGDENVMTVEELQKAVQDREVAWATIKKRTDEYKASIATTTTPNVSTGDFNF